MTRWDLCNAHLRRFSPSTFLEIGTGGGWAGRGEIHADTLVGVDPAPSGPTDGYTHFRRCTSDEFFVEPLPVEHFDVVLVDGLHHAEQVFKDVVNCLGHLSPDGVIVMHDCNPQDEWAQVVPSVRPFWNGDCWKAMVKLRATRPDVHAFTVDTDQGLGLVRKAERPMPLISVPDELTWEGLVANRREWLGLVSPESL